MPHSPEGNKRFSFENNFLGLRSLALFDRKEFKNHSDPDTIFLPLEEF